MKYIKNSGTQILDVPKEFQEKYSLSEKQLKSIIDIGKNIEAHYNAPQDIEWAFENGVLYILQTRPVTV